MNQFKADLKKCEGKTHTIPLYQTESEKQNKGREGGQQGQSWAQKQDEHLRAPEHRAVSSTEARTCGVPVLKQVAVALGVHLLQGIGTESAPMREQPSHIH